MKESAGEGGDEEGGGGSSAFPSDRLSHSSHPGVRVRVTPLWTCWRSVHTLLSLLLLWRESGIFFFFFFENKPFRHFFGFLWVEKIKKANVTPNLGVPRLPLWT